MAGNRIRGLDGLRGIAILLVILFHYINSSALGVFGRLCRTGWVGVDLFFVLSGFLITGILFEAQHKEGYLRNFYARRLLRLFPAYFVFVGLVLLLAHGPGEYPWRITAPYLLFGANIVYIFAPDLRYMGPTTVGHLWSLALEEQFYLLWPWLVALLATRRKILTTCLAGICGSLCLRLLLANAPLPPRTLYAELPTRADALLMGAAIAMLVRDPRFDLRRSIGYIRTAGIIAAIAFWWMGHRIGFSFDRVPVKTWGFSCTAVGAAAAVLLAMTEGTWTNRLCSTRVLQFFGKYSYGIYLIHLAPNRQYWQFQDWLHNYIPQLWLASIVGFLAMLGAVTLTAMLSYNLIEQPFLRLKKRFESYKPLPEEPVTFQLAS